MTYPERWPGTNIVKSQGNAFTSWRDEPRSQFRGDPSFRSNAAPVVTDPSRHRYGSHVSRAVPSGSAKG
jgi:hypothetical protein